MLGLLGYVSRNSCPLFQLQALFLFLSLLITFCTRRCQQQASVKLSVYEVGSVSFILVFCTPSWSVTSKQRRPFPLTYAVRHEAIFAVNAALVASRGTTHELFPCTLPLTLSTRLDRPQVPFSSYSTPNRLTLRCSH